MEPCWISSVDADPLKVSHIYTAFWHNISALLRHLSQTCQYQILRCWCAQLSILWEKEAKNLIPCAGCSSRVRHQIFEYRHLPMSQQSYYSHSDQFCCLNIQFYCHQRCLYLGLCMFGESTQSLEEIYTHSEQQMEARQRQDTWGHLKQYLMPKTTEWHLWSI